METTVRVVLQEGAMDTCLTGLILGAAAVKDVTVRPVGARLDELADPAVLCIEAGGSGDVTARNFDHHEPGGPVEPACVQAAQFASVTESSWLRLVDYVSKVDTGFVPDAPPPAFPTLSNVFSGMLLAEADVETRFRAGMALLNDIIVRDIDPFETIPVIDEWDTYVNAKKLAMAGLFGDVARARLFTTARGRRAGFLVSEHPGALGALYEKGCDYGIAMSERFQVNDHATIRKFTIGSTKGGKVDLLLPVLNALDPGWGGPSHGTIIGSPRTGTLLSADEVCALVCAHC